MKNSIIIDLSLISLLLLLFICSSFIWIDSENININIFILCVVFIVMLITYFTNITTGLIIDLIIIFTVLSFALYIGIYKDFEIPIYIYFWIVIFPICTIVIGAFTKFSLDLQSEVIEMEKKMGDLVTIDCLTGLKNERAFIHDAQVYMCISQRYKHGLVLMVIGIRHKAEVEKIIGKDNMNKLISSISAELLEKIRKEDLVYMVDRKNSLWCVLVMTNETSSVKMISERIKKQISQLNINGIFKFENLNIELRIGTYDYSEKIKTPLEFLELSKKEMEYDV